MKIIIAPRIKLLGFCVSLMLTAAYLFRTELLGLFPSKYSDRMSARFEISNVKLPSVLARANSGSLEDQRKLIKHYAFAKEDMQETLNWAEKALGQQDAEAQQFLAQAYKASDPVRISCESLKKLNAIGAIRLRPEDSNNSCAKTRDSLMPPAATPVPSTATISTPATPTTRR
jgi:hypothetical protein